MRDFQTTQELRSNEVVIYNNAGETIPALSFAEIESYDTVNKYFSVKKPTSDNLSAEKILIVPEAILDTKIGVGVIDGVGVVLKTAGNTVAAGGEVGTDNGEYTAIEGLGFYVITVDGNYLIVRRKSIGSGSSRIAKIKAGGVPSNATGPFTANLLDEDGNAAGEDIDIYPILHLGSNDFDGDVWPDLAALDDVEVFKDLDGKWYIANCIFDDTVECDV